MSRTISEEDRIALGKRISCIRRVTRQDFITLIILILMVYVFLPFTQTFPMIKAQTGKNLTAAIAFAGLAIAYIDHIITYWCATWTVYENGIVIPHKRATLFDYLGRKVPNDKNNPQVLFFSGITNVSISLRQKWQSNKRKYASMAYNIYLSYQNGQGSYLYFFVSDKDGLKEQLKELAQQHNIPHNP